MEHPRQPDKLTSKLAALHYYQLSIPAPKPKPGSFDAAASRRGGALFGGKARCASCHVPPLFTEPGDNLHVPADVCVDAVQGRSLRHSQVPHRPARGPVEPPQPGLYHDGRFATLREVLDHYDACLKLGLSDVEKGDLVEYLKSL